MVRDGYSRLSDISLLRKAWHLARDDAREDFMADPLHYADFGFRIEPYLVAISQAIASGTFRPQSLLRMDVPKSSLAVRPGTVPAIEDRIVLFGIAQVLAPSLDGKIPEGVYSWRLKKDRAKRALFEDHDIFKLPFLKHETIKTRIDVIEPWYGSWPRFKRDIERAWEREGYRYLVLTDIASYFENIDLQVLREILLSNVRSDHKFVNFLVRLMEHWAWNPLHESNVRRGIPQQNGVSSFLGNVYLLPVDQAFSRLSRRVSVRYFRYMDDIKVLAKSLPDARRALFIINDEVKKLGLTIQSRKTRIIQGKAIRAELVDRRFERADAIANEISRKRTISNHERRRYERRLSNLFEPIRAKGTLESDDLRSYRRILTGLKLARLSLAVPFVLMQLDRHPDPKSLRSAIQYLKSQDRNVKAILNKVLHLLREEQTLFPYQRASFFLLLRYVRQVSPDAWRLAKRELRSKSSHWYVRQQAAQLLATRQLSTAELRPLLAAFNREPDASVKVAMLQCLSQLDVVSLRAVIADLLFTPNHRLQSVAHFYKGLLDDREKALDHLHSLFDNKNDEHLVDHLHDLEVLSRSIHASVREALGRRVAPRIGYARRPMLRARLVELHDRVA